MEKIATDDTLPVERTDDDLPIEHMLDMEAGRRAFLRGLGLSAAGACMIGAGATGAQAAGGVADADVLTFALNLEYLEAEFYLRAVTGEGLPDGYIGQTPGQVIGGRQVDFQDGQIKAYAQEIANDERHHVIFLRKALKDAGVNPVSRPALNIRGSFTILARAAGLIGPSDQFDPYASDVNFMLAAYIFEDVGVSAYHGAAQYLVDNTTYLRAAAGILATEAYHAGIIRTVLFSLRKALETKKISALRQQLGPVEQTFAIGADTGVGNPSDPNVTLTDRFGIALERTPQNVLNVVYGKQNVHKGLFFPAGLNGNIK